MLIDLKLNLLATFEAVFLNELKATRQHKWLAGNNHYYANTANVYNSEFNMILQ